MEVKIAVSTTSGERDDRLLPLTKAVAWLIIPFLAAAFLILYVDGRHTARWFAWEIPSRLTTALMGAGYLGGAYFFLRVGLAGRWHRVQAGFPPITLFTTAMLLATLLHWDAFLTGRWPFWVWLVLYIATPILVPLVWWRNRRTDPLAAAAGERIVPGWLRGLMAAAGTFLLLLCLLVFIWPEILIPLWPWTLSPLTSRVLSGWHALLGAGALALAGDRRWSAWPVPMQTIALWQALLLLALFRHQEELSGGFLSGYALFISSGLVGLLAVTLVMRRQPQEGTLA